MILVWRICESCSRKFSQSWWPEKSSLHALCPSCQNGKHEPR